MNKQLDVKADLSLLTPPRHMGLGLVVVVGL